LVVPGGQKLIAEKDRTEIAPLASTEKLSATTPPDVVELGGQK
jgi:hypothetical protein